MLKIKVCEESWDSTLQEFVYTKEQILELEHSLVALSKWESKWCKAFLTKREKSDEEILDYIKFMTLTENVDPDVYNHLSRENVEEIRTYIESPMTATHISGQGGKSSKETVTSELIYYWMITLNVPFECENWHLNRLLTLIKVCNAKNQPPKKTNGKALASKYAALNAARRKQLNSTG
jgi:hypothetical protein